MKMKRSILLLLVLALMVSVFAVGCGGDDAEPETPAVDDGGEDTGDEDTGEGSVGGQIIAGNTTEMSGEWIGATWTNNAADKTVRDLINGYSTVEYDSEGEFHINETSVKDHEIVENEDGTKTHIWTIAEDLTYDDGTPIDARDYVSGILLFSNKIVGDMGGGNTAGADYVGWSDYATGETQVFEGVNILDDYKFSVTFSADKVPYYWELSGASAGPTQWKWILGDDEVDVVDKGEGAFFTKDGETPLELTIEDYEDAINTARFAVPRPATGAYYIKEYDEETKTVVLEINESFKGTYNGTLPSIQTIIQKKTSQETQLDELKTGSIDLIPSLTSGTDIDGGFDILDEDPDGFDYIGFPRAGYGKLMFSCDFGPTQDTEVRQAIAHLLDRNEFAKSFTGGYGSVVHGPYGEGQWYYVERKDEIEAGIDQYPYDVEAAKTLLDEAGWVMGDDGVRYKEIDGEKVPLVIQWASTQDNEVSDLLVVSLQQNPDLAEVGMKIEQTTMDFTELLAYMYRDASQGDQYGVPTYHMYNLASNFPQVYDRKYDVTTDPEMWKRGYNSGRINDKELEEIALDMVYRDPTDRDGFLDGFKDFIIKWNSLLPELPLYSNEYHSFFNSKLKGYEPTSMRDQLLPLIYAHIEE